MEAVDMLMRRTGLAKTDLDRVACMGGPGSFTGLRIGFSAAKGLSLALSIPLIAVPTLDCIAFSRSSWRGVVLPLIDAKKGAFFTALYRENERISPYMDAGIDAIFSLLPRDAQILLTGPDAVMIIEEANFFCPGRVFLDPSHRRGSAGELLEMAKHITVNNIDGCSAPLYIRKSDAEKG
jgi:tRNA threonylcarbamoyladenosine biosynthesis protein TsaB